MRPSAISIWISYILCGHYVDLADAFPRSGRPSSDPFLRQPRQTPRSGPAGSHVQRYSQSTNNADIDLEILKGLDTCESTTAARRILQQAVATKESPLYGSVTIPPGASDRSISDGDLAIQTKIRNKKYSIFDLIDLNGDRDADRASAGVLGVFLASSLSAIAANESLPGPEILRFCVVWILSFSPLAMVGYGIATPEKLQQLLVAMQGALFPSYRKRMLQHEAGHFLMAHLLGFPIQGYSVNAVKNAVEFYPLNDPDAGQQRAKQLGFDRRSTSRLEQENSDESLVASSSTPFFSDEGRGGESLQTQSVFRKSSRNSDNFFLKLPSQLQPQNTWPFRGFDHATVDKLSVVSVAGICAEILALGNAEGGIADFSQLRQLLANADPELTERDIENRIRFSLGFTMTQLRLHLGVLDDLADAMDRGSTVAECVAVIEGCKNISGNDGIFNDYDVRRRQKFRSMKANMLEKLMLGEKNADAEEDRLVLGKGGGYKQENKFIQLSGDDPLYVALGISCLFLAWAASGGISL